MWRRWTDHSMEFSVTDAGLENRSRPGGREYDRTEARRVHSAVRRWHLRNCVSKWGYLQAW